LKFKPHKKNNDYLRMHSSNSPNGCLEEFSSLICERT